ncbi:LamG-like jellyroll fold domain-containing protein [Acidianus brierleyi]|uniref:LamG-like jellyroll fold domain-containing protein n=1 Tax=Acidianus brierleyi TaxID=41673 RepID=A0A2U9ID65_9CREN|nr:LamG-like jellyroll fold domain-containing protein [Acidianus brierleyi]AWR93946.1 LamG domain-containing protein [Acidianus brierleyi]
MGKLNRRQFLDLLLKSGVIAGAGALSTGVLVKKDTPTKGSTQGYPLLGQFLATVVQSSNEYTAYDAGGNVLFNGSCADGSGTCGIYEAVNFVQQNYRYGKVGLIGSFYPVNSPDGQFNVELDGSAIVYLNSASSNFMISIPKSKSVTYLWYQSAGMVNSILTRKQSFSLQPYVLFPGTVTSMFLGNNDQYLGTPSAFTISAWVNGFGVNTYGTGYVISYGSTEKGIIWAIQNTNGRLCFRVSSRGVCVAGPSSSPWHVAAVYNGGNLQLYLNGNLAGNWSGVNVEYYPSKYPAYLWIGNIPIATQQGGLIPANGPFAWLENIQFYNTALSSSQVSQLASSPAQDPVDYSALVSWSLYRYIFFVGDLITGVGYQRMYGFSESGVF